MHTDTTLIPRGHAFGTLPRRGASGMLVLGLLLSMAGLVGFLGQGIAGSTTIEPQHVDGNPTCADLGYDHQFKIEDPTDGTYSDGVITVTIDVVATGVVSWTSDLPVDAVIVKGGPAAHVYVSGGATAGTELVTPINPGGNRPAISHITFCYSGGATTTSSGPTTTSTTVAPTTTSTVAPTTTSTTIDVGGATTSTSAPSTTTTTDLGGSGTTLPFVGPGSSVSGGGFVSGAGAGFTGGTSGGVLPFTGNATWLFLLGVALLGAGTLLLSLTRPRSPVRADL